MEGWLAELQTLAGPARLSSRWAMVGARLIDGEPDGFAGVGGLLIDDGKIVASGARVTTDALGDTPAVDMGLRFILPGLVDTHVHLSWDASASPVETLLAELARPEVLRERAQENALQALSVGTTTVRDLGGPNEVVFNLRDAIRDGRAPGPRMLASGAVITTPRGHCHFMGRLATGARQAASAVADQARLGSDVIKVVATGGVHTPGSDPGRSQYDLRALMAIVLAARTAGLPVTAHATSKVAIRSAVAAGVDSIQHGGPMDAWTIDQMARRGVRLVPTLGTNSAVLRSDDPRIPDDVRRKAAKRVVSGQRAIAFQRAVSAGVPIAAGTDSGTTFVAHGSLPNELQVLNRVGLPVRAAIAAATSVAARELGLTGVIGSLAVGSEADLIVLDSDPVADLRALEAPTAVLQRGRLVADRNGLIRSAAGRNR